MTSATVAKPSRSRQRLRHSAEERRQQVVQAAVREFAEQGYQAASTAAIARRAGISQPYIYALFPSKQELFLAAHDEMMARISAAFTEAAREGGTPEQRLDRMGEVYPTLIADRFLLLMQLHTFATGEPAIVAHAARAFRDLYALVIQLTGAAPVQVSLFFACGMLANVTTALGLQEICAPLFEASLEVTPGPG